MKRTASKVGLPKTNGNLNKWLRCGAIWCAVFVLIASATSFAVAAPFSVTTTNDNGDNLSPTTGSLRAAIIGANATAAADVITFSGAGIGTISPPISLPTITQPLVIDGYTGTAASVATAATPATLFVEISGASAGNSGIGLQFSSTGCTTTNCRILGVVINRFGESGIRINSGSVGIFGNFIGTDINGTSNLCGTPQVSCGNVNRGILIVGSTGNAIGNTSIENRNIISANSGSGISITGGGSATVVRNFIGTDKNGTADLGNTQDGVRIVDSSNSTIGGGNSSSRNVISGNDGNGVAIIQSSNAVNAVATGNVISANFIGVDATGNATTIIGGFQTSPVGNSGSGVLINASGNTVGGTRTTSFTSSTCVNGCNVIAGNRANGVSIRSSFATANTVSGNNIGVGADNATSIGNRDNGVQVSNLAGNNNTIGGTGVTAGFCNNVCNVIANNGDPSANSGRAGVYADDTAGVGNAISRNSIFNNTGIGIDLDTPGANGNDLRDPDTGANNIQNTPSITSADSRSGVISGTLNSTATADFIIDFYSNATPDTPGTSEGRTFIGSLPVTTDSNGNVNFASPPVALTNGQFITATATSSGLPSSNNTSEISNAQTVTAGAPAATGIEGDVAQRMTGDGILGSSDVTVMERFILGLDTPNSAPNEFQRADCAPYATRGDGILGSGDITQVERYILGRDAQQTGGGPLTRGGPQPGRNSVENKSVEDTNLISPTTTRSVTPVAVSRTGNTLTVGIVLNTGNAKVAANSLSFTLNFMTAELSAPTNIRRGSGANSTAGNQATLNNNPDNAATGQLGILIRVPAGETFALGSQQLVLIDFTVAMGVTLTTLSFGDTPTQRFISNVAGNRLDNVDGSTFVANTISPTGPTAAPVSVGGRLQTATGAGISGASVALLDPETGETFKVVTDTSGGYVFVGVPVGKNYIVTPTALRYSFNPRSKFLSVIEGLTAVDFVAARSRKPKF